ncbi:ExbD/TolR family protein [Pseudodonghicola flavimaris]|uniref:Biopolymer transporter ExbD n=1 Tax=Pseudodonghicola flavimaris TaxID=3050036 RepID=A0ABT7F5C9_9RHOB|nr:biopolymer transporter ExbD [Pseudodonghicola flavimaris]MDK3019818.1 biopolymer transporter ExbD [Pseudodonghicola flavimaris]
MTFDDPRPPRRISLTPMIDVVFLLLVFFMLASRFGVDMQIPLRTAGGASAEYQGPPRLVQIDPEGLKLNGRDITPEALIDSLGDLTQDPGDVIVLRSAEEVPLQRLVEVMDALHGAGFQRLVLVE